MKRKIPIGWKCYPLKMLVDPNRPITYGIVQPGAFTEGGVLLIRGQDYSRGWVSVDAMYRVSEAIDRPYRRSRVTEGDLLITIVGAGTGNIAKVPLSQSGANITQTTARIAIDASRADADYVKHQLQGMSGKREVYHHIKGGAQPGLNISDVDKFIIPLPPLSEQRKIAKMLSAWDDTIETLDALITAKDRQKQALMQHLLTGKTRVKGAKGTVKFIKASELFANRSERNADDLPILSVTQDQGVVLRSSLERRIAHDEETNGSYKVVRKWDFIISLRSFQGGLEFSEIEGAVSPAYHVIHPICDLDLQFFRHYFKSADFVSRLATAVIGIRDGKQISFTDFGFIKLPFPPIEDQRSIGQLLDAADQELTLLRTQRQTLDQQKRGLMQRLLTGKIRVKIH